MGEGPQDNESAIEQAKDGILRCVLHRRNLRLIKVQSKSVTSFARSIGVLPAATCRSRISQPPWIATRIRHSSRV